MITDKIDAYLNENLERDDAIEQMFGDAEREMKQIYSSRGDGDPLAQALQLCADVFDSIEQEALSQLILKIVNKWAR